MIADSGARLARADGRTVVDLEARAHDARQLKIYLLGGFRVERNGLPIGDDAWGQRRLAKTLVKLLAVERNHSLHRDQILEMLWPDVGPDSALNAFSKALHAARRALEPGLLPRAASKYLRLNDDILSLSQDDVWIDVDYFDALAEQALHLGNSRSYLAASEAYTGDLLPEDRYEDWAEERRTSLRDTRGRLLFSLADALVDEGSYDAAAGYLRQLLQDDPAREDVHRRLMLLYEESGNRHEALRQYDLCRQALERDLDAEPEAETEALRDQIVANKIQKRVKKSGRPDVFHGGIPPLQQEVGDFTTPLVGRDRVLGHLIRDLERTEAGQGRLVLIGGETGVGKQRLAAELVREAHSRGVQVLWGAGTSAGDNVPYGLFIAAFESYLGRLSAAERDILGQSNPDLARLIPSLGALAGVLPAPTDADGNRAAYSILRLLLQIGKGRPILLFLGDLHAADAASLQLVEYLARLSPQQKLLLIGTYSEEDMERGGRFHRMLASMQRKSFCLHIELRRLARQDADRLVQALLPSGFPDEELLEHVYSLTLGNPLFIEEVVSTMKDLGQLVLVDDMWRIGDAGPGRVPGRIRDLVELRLAHLDTDMSRVLSMAATAETPFSFNTLRIGAAALHPPVPDTVLLETLDRAVSSRILVEREEGYAFRHPLFQQALTEDLSRPRRAQLRTALSGNAEQSMQRRADDGADRRRNPGRRATDRVGAGALSPHDSIARQYGELLDRLEADGRMLEGAAARRKLAAALTALGRYNRAAQVLLPAAAVYDSVGDLEAKRAVEAQVALLGIMESDIGPGSTALA